MLTDDTQLANLFFCKSSNFDISNISNPLSFRKIKVFNKVYLKFSFKNYNIVNEKSNSIFYIFNEKANSRYCSIFLHKSNFAKL